MCVFACVCAHMHAFLSLRVWKGHWLGHVYILSVPGKRAVLQWTKAPVSTCHLPCGTVSLAPLTLSSPSNSPLSPPLQEVMQPGLFLASVSSLSLGSS